MNKRLLACLVLLFCLCLSVHDAFAKRLGAGSSIGRQRETTTLQRAPAPLPPPAAAPSPLPPAAAPAFGQGARPGMVPAPAPRSSWMGPLAGFAGGALLGGLLFGHGGGGGGFGLGGLLLPLLLIGGFIFLLRRFMASAIPAPQAVPQQGGWTAPEPDYAPAQPYVPAAQSLSVGQPALAAPPRPDLVLPAGFDLPGFLRESKLAFVRLQAANDRADLQDLREFSTPQMFAELSLQIQDRHNARQQTDVLALDADLLDLTVVGDEAVASVQFTGTLREDGGAPSTFTELWHVRKRLQEPGSPWLLAGIQQIA